MAQTYATTTCCNHCAPFKNFPGAYAECCKQYAACPPIKPAAVKPGVIKSRFPKPLTTGQLHQGQVKLVDDYNSPDNTATQKLNDIVKGATDNLTGGSAPTGGGGSGSLFPPEITHKTSGCGKGGKECERLQVGWTNGANTSDLRVSITIPSTMKVQDTATLQMGGSRHSGDCTSVQGYKAYIGINGGKNGVGIETGSCGHKVYPHDFPNSNKAPLFTLQPGHTYNLRGTKENLSNGVRVTAYAQEDNGPVTMVANNYLPLVQCEYEHLQNKNIALEFKLRVSADLFQNLNDQIIDMSKRIEAIRLEYENIRSECDKEKTRLQDIKTQIADQEAIVKNSENSDDYAKITKVVREIWYYCLSNAYAPRSCPFPPLFNRSERIQ